MNTEISYTYTDASGYHTSNTVILKGELTNKQIQTIINCLDSKEFFIPKQVGLPEKRFDSISDDDHPWFEISKNSFKETSDKSTLDISCLELYTNFLQAKGNWDEIGRCFELASI